jgi:hypothetical protein
MGVGAVTFRVREGLTFKTGMGVLGTLRVCSTAAVVVHGARAHPAAINVDRTCPSLENLGDKRGFLQRFPQEERQPSLTRTLDEKGVSDLKTLTSSFNSGRSCAENDEMDSRKVPTN